MLVCRRGAQVLCCLLFIGLVGCGSKGPETPPAYPVSGVLTQNGKPVAGATVNFTSTTASRIASGVTNENGEFQLSTFGQNDGAVEGTHQVTVIKLDPELQMKPNEDADAYTTRVLGKDPGKSLLPAKYASPLTSQLTAEVSASGPNTFQFDLK